MMQMEQSDLGLYCLPYMSVRQFRIIAILVARATNVMLTHTIRIEIEAKEDFISHIARKHVFWVSDQVLHKPGCATTEGG